MPESVLGPSAFSMSAVWRQQVGSHLRRRRRPRNLAVVTYVVRCNATNKLIDIRRLTVCVLHDEFDQAGAPSIRFAAYRLGQIALGITVGGPDQILLDKDWRWRLGAAPTVAALLVATSAGCHWPYGWIDGLNAMRGIRISPGQLSFACPSFGFRLRLPT